MNKRQENFFSMFKGVNELLGQKAALFVSILAFPPLQSRLKDIEQRIEVKDNLYNSIAAGKTVSKKKAEEILVKLVLEIASALYLLASANGNEQLKSLSEISSSKLTKLRDTLLLAKARDIYSFAVENSTALADYSISETRIQDLADAADTYDSALGTKTVSFADRQKTREELKGLFAEASSVLRNELDKMVHLLKNTEPGFYETYRNTRKIADLGIRHSKETADA